MTHEGYTEHQLNQLLRLACEAEEIKKAFLDGCGRLFDGRTEEAIIQAVKTSCEHVFDGCKMQKS
jgi:hypothetical protein